MQLAVALLPCSRWLRHRQKQMANNPAELNYLATGPYCWGKGKTRAEAVRNARSNFPRAFLRNIKVAQDKHFSIWTSTGEFTVTGLGDITSTVDDIQKLQTSSLATE